MNASAPVTFVGPEIETALSWADTVQAIVEGHKRLRAELGDTLLQMENGELLTRSASVQGLGAGVKAATIVPGNPNRRPPRPTVQGAFFLFEETTGDLIAVIDGATLTRWKTVSDSLAAASIVARPDPEILTVVGTGLIASALIEGYQSFFPTIRKIFVWGRSQDKAETLAARHRNAKCAADRNDALYQSDIVASATAAAMPIIHGDAIKPGAHIDLVGAHGPAMREADDDLISKARLFVDCKETVIDHIGEIAIPIKEGVITRNDIEGDLYDLCAMNGFQRRDSDITLYKNGGGAHLDLMIARCFADIAFNKAPQQ